jgi:hypothetical protein
MAPLRSSWFIDKGGIRKMPGNTWSVNPTCFEPREGNRNRQAIRIIDVPYVALKKDD